MFSLLLGTVLLLVVSQRQAKAQEEYEVIRAGLAVQTPEELSVPDTQGFELNILCDRTAEVYFSDSESVPTQLSYNVYQRNRLLESATGAVITAVTTDDFYSEASSDILSGTFSYNLYAADAAGELSKLFAAGALQNVADSEYIRMDSDRYDGRLMKQLSLGGCTALISCASPDARGGAAVVAYNRELLYELESKQETTFNLVQKALDGEFTAEVLLEVSRVADDTFLPYADELSALTGQANEQEKGFYGLSLDKDDFFSVFFAFGGRFVTVENTSFAVNTLDGINTALENSRALFAEESITYDFGAFERGEALFAVCTLKEAAALASDGLDIGILPMPKGDASQDYHTYINLSGTPMLAIPDRAPDAYKAEYLVDRMAFFSESYIEPLLWESITRGEPVDEKILELIGSSAGSDLSGLFGYGNISELLVSTLESEDGRLAVLDYYNRKTLYEKALAIIAKRYSAE